MMRYLTVQGCFGLDMDDVEESIERDDQRQGAWGSQG